MAEEEKTLLEQVREKEVYLAAEYARACADAEAAREAAAQEARGTIERAEREGHEAAEARYEREMNGLELEIERLRADARTEEDALRSTGEARVAGVADELVGYVAPERA
jgi:hypothetical protein